GSDPAGVVQITASGVHLDGFVVQGDNFGPGVSTSSTASGYLLIFNTIQLNQYGVDLNTDGAAETELSDNCVMNNETLSSGVLTSSGYSNVVFSNNFFTGHMCAAIS